MEHDFDAVRPRISRELFDVLIASMAKAQPVTHILKGREIMSEMNAFGPIQQTQAAMPEAFPARFSIGVAGWKAAKTRDGTPKESQVMVLG